MYKNNSHICNRILFQFSQLTRMDEILWDQLELKSFANDFLNKFTKQVS